MPFKLTELVYFKTIPALQTLCKLFESNFSWSRDKYKLDLRVAIALLY